MGNYHNPGGASEHGRLVKSRTAVATVLTGTHTFCRVPQYAFVTDIWFETLEATTAAEITVGFTGNGETANTDYFMDGSDNLGVNLGLTRASQSATEWEGKYFEDASGAITVTTDTDLTAGKFRLWVEYYVCH